MIAIISPAKSLDFDRPVQVDIKTEPIFTEEANYLANKLSSFSKNKLVKLMHISDKLAEENYKRYQDWNFTHTLDHKKQAIFLFKGEVYVGFDVQQFSKAELDYSQYHLRILSGMYGILKPMDMIQPYRLEMGTKWSITPKTKNLYQYWNTKIADHLNQSLEHHDEKLIVNLASKEYFKAIDQKTLNAPIVDISFKDFKNGQYKVLSFFAKKARGAFARYMMKNEVNSLNALKLFNEDRYAFDSNLSSESEFVFTR